MTFLAGQQTDYCLINDDDSFSAVGSDFRPSFRIKTIGARYIPTPRHMSQLERDAMDRAFWRSVTVIDDGSEG